MTIPLFHLGCTYKIESLCFPSYERKTIMNCWVHRAPEDTEPQTCGVILLSGSRQGNPCKRECDDGEVFCPNHLEEFLVYYWTNWLGDQFQKLDQGQRRNLYQELQPRHIYSYNGASLEAPSHPFLEWIGVQPNISVCCAHLESGSRRNQKCNDTNHPLSEVFCRYHFRRWLNRMWKGSWRDGFLTSVTEQEQKMWYIRYIRSRTT